MRKLTHVLGIGALLAATLAVPSTALAATYPDAGVLPTATTITLPDGDTACGETITISASSSGEGNPAGTLTVQAFGRTESGSGTVSFSVDTPAVSSAKVSTVKASFTPTDTARHSPSSASVAVTVLPRSSADCGNGVAPISDTGDSNGILPDTGAGASLTWLLGAGVLLIVVGTLLVAARRRRVLSA